MRRVVVLVVLLTVGSLSLVVRAYLPPAAGSGLQQAPRVVNVEKLKDNLFVLKGGGGGEHRRLRRRHGRCGRRYEESGMGPAAAGQDQ